MDMLWRMLWGVDWRVSARPGLGIDLAGVFANCDVLARTSGLALVVRGRCDVRGLLGRHDPCGRSTWSILLD